MSIFYTELLPNFCLLSRKLKLQVDSYTVLQPPSETAIKHVDGFEGPRARPNSRSWPLIFHDCFLIGLTFFGDVGGVSAPLQICSAASILRIEDQRQNVATAGPPKLI